MSAGSDGYGHLIRKAAVVLWAGAFLIAGAKAEAGVTVSGVPGWLEAPVKRSLEAVWKEVVQRSSPGRERVVELVAKRLFPGLDISEIRGFGEDLFVYFDTRESERLSWNVVSIPEGSRLSLYLCQSENPPPPIGKLQGATSRAFQSPRSQDLKRPQGKAFRESPEVPAS